MNLAGINIPGASEEENPNLAAIAEELWNLDDDDDNRKMKRKIALSILIQLCDSIVWWTQRYKRR